MFRHINQLAKKTLIKKISSGLLGLEFKSNNTIKSKAMKLIVKKTLPDYKYHCLILPNVKNYGNLLRQL